MRSLPSARSSARYGGAVLAMAATVLLGSVITGPAASAATFANTTAMSATATLDTTFPCFAGHPDTLQVTAATPYPSHIAVAGLPGPIQDVNVSLHLSLIHI